MKTNKIRQVQSIKTRLDKQDISMTRQKAANINKNGNIVHTQFFKLKMFNWLSFGVERITKNKSLKP